jgi:ribulose 1,5-bisphosphate carboxylase large subunit-like protein
MEFQCELCTAATLLPITSAVYTVVSVQTIKKRLMSQVMALLLHVHQSQDPCNYCRYLVHIYWQEAKVSNLTVSDVKINCPISLLRHIKTVYCFNAKDHGRWRGTE